MIEFAVVEVTSRCNLTCAHCYGSFEPGGSGGAELGRAEQDVVHRALLESGCRSVTISGGEPMLVGDETLAFASRLRDSGLRVVLATNGTLLDRHPAERYAVFDHVQVSVDGPAEVHDRIRGAGSHAAAMRGAAHVRPIVASVALQMTLTQINQHCFDTMYSRTRKLGFKLSVERGSAIGRGAVVGPADPQVYRRVLDVVYADRLLTSEPLLNRLVCERKGIRPPRLCRLGCSAGRDGVAIGAGLEVWPCVRLRIGDSSLRTNGLREILGGEVFRDLADRTRLRGRCGACDYRDVCGGCRADAFAESGDFLGEDHGCCFPDAEQMRQSGGHAIAKCEYSASERTF